LRFGTSPYKGAANGDTEIVYLYEGERAYIHGYRVGLKFDEGPWRFDAFLRQRYEGYTQDRAPTSTTGMAFREPGIDAGFSVRRRTAWGTPYAEVTQDVSNRSEGVELKLGYWNEWTRGAFTLKPHLAVSIREAKLNNYYYGVAPSEATAERPAYLPGGGVDLAAMLYGTYRLTENWQLFGSVGALRRSSGVRESPIVDDRLETTAMVGLLYDLSPQIRRSSSQWDGGGKPLIARTYYGYSSDCDVLEIMKFQCTSTHTKDQTDVWAFEVGRTLIKEPNGWPVDIAGFVGMLRHLEKGYQDDFWQFNAYLKVYYWGFPWDKYLRTRIGMGTGLSYAEHIPEMEVRDQERRDRGTWKVLNYLDPSIDFRLGDVIPARSLRETYVGLGVSHRSGMFGKSLMFGNVNGGSNYIYLYAETTF